MAWPSVIHISFILSALYLKGSSGQQNGLANQANTNTPLGSSLPNNLNRISKCPLHQKLLKGQLCGNLQQQQLNLQQAALQQQLNLQQAANFQQASNLQPGVNMPQANLPQMNVPPNINQFNLQQPGNMQQLNLQQTGNLQQLNMQPPGNLQQFNTQQLQPPSPNLPLGLQLNNFQQNLPPTLASLQLANNQVSDISLASTPMLNSQFSGIPQIHQQLPDAGMLSPIAPSMSYSFNSAAQPVPMGYRNNQPVVNPTAPFTPITDMGTINNQQYALVAVPIQNQRSVNAIQPNIPNPMPGSPNQVTIIKSVQPQGYFDPIAPSSELDQNKLALISSMISDTGPAQFPSGSLLNGNSILGAALSKSGSKSSNLQALLPLIFNLLKEKNNGCTCHHCGYTNNKQEPQIFNEYPKQNNRSQETKSVPLENNEDIEETTESPETMTETPDDKKSIKENTINNADSREQESDNDLDNYDDEE